MKRCVPLESAAEKVCNQSAVPPLIFQLPPKQGRKMLEEAQSAPVYKAPAYISSCMVNTMNYGVIPVYFVMSQTLNDIKNVIFYIHGGGWVFGSFHTHEKLVRELAARTQSLVVFPEYTLSPEAQYPVALEQCYFVFSHIKDIINANINNVNCNSLIAAGDSVGGNMAISMCLLSKMRCGYPIQKLLLYYPVTNACFNTLTYRRFAVNYYLYRAGMQWFWDNYTTSVTDRDKITASPLRADIDCLKYFPKTMIINGQADVLRSEGEAFGEKLLSAGADVTAVQIQGTIHDFVMLNSLDKTNACRTAMNISVDWICGK